MLWQGFGLVGWFDGFRPTTVFHIWLFWLRLLLRPHLVSAVWDSAGQCLVCPRWRYICVGDCCWYQRVAVAHWFVLLCFPFSQSNHQSVSVFHFDFGQSRATTQRRSQDVNSMVSMLLLSFNFLCVVSLCPSTPTFESESLSDSVLFCFCLCFSGIFYTARGKGHVQVACTACVMQIYFFVVFFGFPIFKLFGFFGNHPFGWIFGIAIASGDPIPPTSKNEHHKQPSKVVNRVITCMHEICKAFLQWLQVWPVSIARCQATSEQGDTKYPGASCTIGHHLRTVSGPHPPRRCGRSSLPPGGDDVDAVYIYILYTKIYHICILIHIFLCTVYRWSYTNIQYIYNILYCIEVLIHMLTIFISNPKYYSIYRYLHVYWCLYVNQWIQPCFEMNQV